MKVPSNKLLLIAALLGLTRGVLADEVAPIKIGEVNSYTGPVAVFTQLYRKGLDLYVEQANAKGGVLGRKLEIIYRDDAGSPADALRMANELVLDEKVNLLAGTFLSPIGLAVASYAQQNHVLFVATEPLTDKLTWAKGSRYVFRVEEPISHSTAVLVTKAATLKCSRWAGTGPLGEAVLDMFDDFKAGMARAQPGFVWAGQLLSPLGKMNAGSTIDYLQRTHADCILNAQAGPDLVTLLREGKARGYFDKVQVVSLHTGMPEWLDSLGSDAPVGWYVSGYPWQDVPWPAHKQFVADFEAKYHSHPGFGSFIGFLSGQAIAAGIERAGSTDTEQMIKGFRGAEFDSLVGRSRWRLDHQLDLGGWVGRVAEKDGAAAMVDWQFTPGSEGLPSEEEGLALRPQGANE